MAGTYSEAVTHIQYFVVRGIGGMFSLGGNYCEYCGCKRGNNRERACCVSNILCSMYLGKVVAVVKVPTLTTAIVKCDRSNPYLHFYMVPMRRSCVSLSIC